MFARENAGLYTITGGRLSDFVPYHLSKFSRFTSGTLSFDAPRIAAGGFYLIGSANIGNFRESRTIVG